MARLLPEDPSFVNETERQVVMRLVDQLGASDLVLCNQHFTVDGQDRELDAILVLPGSGLVVVEIKGGSLTYVGGEWMQQSRSGEKHRVTPATQVAGNKYTLRKYLIDDPRWGSRGHPRMAHAVVAPHTDFDPDFHATDAPREAVHGRSDQPNLGVRLRRQLEVIKDPYYVPTTDDVVLIEEILNGRLPPRRDDPQAYAEERAARIERLTDEQAMLLRATRLIPRVEIRGGAGSGKTHLAMTQAAELTKGTRDVPAQRVALVCYSIGLAEWFKRDFKARPYKQRPAFIGTFAELGRSWGADVSGTRDDSTFWEQDLPKEMALLASQLRDDQRFDAIIVDEAQDFADLWWRPILKALRDEDNGRLSVYSDEHQRVFARFGRPPVALVPLVLDHNLRNTKQIAQSFAMLGPERMSPRGGDGPEVEFLPASPTEALGVADDQVERLLDQGWEPGSIALVTTGSRHPVQREQQERDGQIGYWQTFWEGEDVFYGHVLGCKGLERHVVILVVNEDGSRDRARERLYVGMSRATDLLIVVGDPAVIRSVGGESLVRRLGIGS